MLKVKLSLEVNSMRTGDQKDNPLRKIKVCVSRGPSKDSKQTNGRSQTSRPKLLKVPPACEIAVIPCYPSGASEWFRLDEEGARMWSLGGVVLLGVEETGRVVCLGKIR